MRPDFIAGWSSTFTDKVLRSTEFWNERGVHTYISPNSAPANRNRTIENEYADILNLGKIFDREEKAESLVKEMKDEISRTVRARQLLQENIPADLLSNLWDRISVSTGRKPLQAISSEE